MPQGVPGGQVGARQGGGVLRTHPVRHRQQAVGADGHEGGHDGGLPLFHEHRRHAVPRPHVPDALPDGGDDARAVERAGARLLVTGAEALVDAHGLEHVDEVDAGGVEADLDLARPRPTAGLGDQLEGVQVAGVREVQGDPVAPAVDGDPAALLLVQWCVAQPRQVPRPVPVGDFVLLVGAGQQLGGHVLDRRGPVGVQDAGAQFGVLVAQHPHEPPQSGLREVRPVPGRDLLGGAGDGPQARPRRAVRGRRQGAGHLHQAGDVLPRLPVGGRAVACRAGRRQVHHGLRRRAAVLGRCQRYAGPLRGEYADVHRGAPLLQGLAQCGRVRLPSGFRQEGPRPARRLRRGAFAGFPGRVEQTAVEALLRGFGGDVAELHPGGVRGHGTVVGPQPEVRRPAVVVHRLEGDQAVPAERDRAVQPQRLDAPRQDPPGGHGVGAQHGARDGLEADVQRDRMTVERRRPGPALVGYAHPCQEAAAGRGHGLLRCAVGVQGLEAEERRAVVHAALLAHLPVDVRGVHGVREPGQQPLRVAALGEGLFRRRAVQARLCVRNGRAVGRRADHPPAGGVRAGRLGGGGDGRAVGRRQQQPVQVDAGEAHPLRPRGVEVGGRGDGHLAQGGAGHHDHVVDAVPGQPGQRLGGDAGLPQMPSFTVGIGGVRSGERVLGGGRVGPGRLPQGGGVDDVPGALPGGRRDVGQRAVVVAVGPVQRVAGAVQGRHVGVERQRVVGVAQQGGHDRGVGVAVRGERGLHRMGQHRVGADLHEQPVPVLGRGPYRVGEAHHAAEVVRPVGGVEEGVLARVVGDGAVEGRRR